MDRHKAALKINISFYSIMPSCSRGCQHPTHTPPESYCCACWPNFRQHLFTWGLSLASRATLLASIAGQICKELTTYCPPEILDQCSAGDGVYISQLPRPIGGITLGGMFYTPGVPRWNESPVSHNSNYTDCLSSPLSLPHSPTHTS